MKVGAKEYLQSIQRMEMTITQKRQELVVLASMQGVSYDTPRVCSDQQRRATEDRAVRRSQIAEQLEAEIDQYITRRAEIVRQIQGLDNTAYADVLYRHYVLGHRLLRIAGDMGYSYDRIKHLHGEALIAFGQKYKT